MRYFRNRPSRRSFLQRAAGATAATAFGIGWPSAEPLAQAPTGFPKTDPRLMITLDQVRDWNAFKAKCGPTYAGGAGWKRYTDFLLDRMQEFGAVDLDHVDITYDHYVVD